MKYRVITMALASAALVSSPVLAQQGKGQQTREQSRKSSQGPSNADQTGVRQSNENSVLKGSGGGQSGKSKRDQARKGSQSGANASEQGRGSANQNSAIANVQPGQMVHDKNGKMLGRVKEVRRSPDGVIIANIVVLVVQIDGSNQITLSPGSLAIVNGVLVTTQITAPSGS